MSKKTEIVRSEEVKFDFSNRVVIITGASSGIGKDLAIGFAEAGAKLAVMARREDRLKEVVDEITEANGTAMYVVCDVKDEQQTLDAVQQVVNAYGTVDILVNNAGVTGHSVPGDDMAKSWDECMDTNLRGSWLMIRACLPYMLEKHYGKIVNLSSVYGIRPTMGTPLHPYFASKAGVIGLTQGIAAYYGPQGIYCNAVLPGAMPSEITERRYFSSPEWIAKVSAQTPCGRPGKHGEMNGPIMFLSSDMSSYVNGQHFAVDGGSTVVL